MFNPLSAMVAIWHYIIVSFQVLAQKGFIRTWIFWVICICEMFTLAMRVFGLVDVGQHPPILASQEQLACRGLRWMRRWTPNYSRCRSHCASEYWQCVPSNRYCSNSRLIWALMWNQLLPNSSSSLSSRPLRMSSTRWVGPAALLPLFAGH